MILMVLVVICYTITSLNDKYAVSKAEMIILLFFLKGNPI